MRFSKGDPSKKARGRKMRHASRNHVHPPVFSAGLLVLALVALTVAAGCGASSDAGTVSTTEGSESTTSTLPAEETTTTMPSQTTTSVGEDTLTVNVYYSRDYQGMSAAARVVPKTQQLGAAAMRALLEGPTAEERAAGMVTSIPRGTTFLGLTIENGVATVDLSKEYASGGGSLSMLTRLAEVVFTLTQFPTVEGVNFKLDGEPVGVFGSEGFVLDHPLDRTEYVDLTPAILVESPTVGNAVSSPLHITGTANVYEGVFRIKLVNEDGLVIADEIVTAASGTGTRGTFDVAVPFTIGQAGGGALTIFAESPKDGSQTDLVEIPLKLEK